MSDNKNLKPIFVGIIFIVCIFAVALILSKVLDRGGNEFDIIASEETTDNESNAAESSENVTYEIFEGYKRYEYDNGDIYDGYWENDLYNGQGTLYKTTGEIYEGNWKDCYFIQGNVTYKTNNFGGTRTVKIGADDEDSMYAVIEENGNLYDGDLFEGKKSGVGVMYSVDTQKIYDGVWDDDHFLEGTITSLYSDGLHTYVVEVKDGFYNGKGILYDENGNIEEEELWRDDQLINE